MLSPSTEAYDRGEKFRYYRQIPSLRHYILIAQHERRVEHFTRHENGLWAQVGEYTAPDDHLRIPEMDIRIPLAAIYRRAGLPEG